MKLFRTHFETEIRAPYTPPQAFIVYAASASQELGWRSTYISPSGMIAQTQPAQSGAVQEVTIRKTRQGLAIKSANQKDSIADWGVNEKIVTSFKDAYSAQQAMLPPEEVDYRYSVISPYFTASEDKLEQGRYEAAHKPDSIWSILKPVKGYTATPVILMINVLIFVLMVFNGVGLFDPAGEDLLEWGANYGPLTLNGEWWRLLSAAFIHIGGVHLLMNMLALVYAGAFLEPLIGTKKFAVAYVITAICSSLLGLYMHPHIMSAGASGAIFGMFGVLIALLTTRLIPPGIRKRLLLLMGYYVVYNLLYGMKAGIDNAGHIGGFTSGLALGYVFYNMMRKPVIKIAAGKA